MDVQETKKSHVGVNTYLFSPKIFQSLIEHVNIYINIYTFLVQSVSENMANICFDVFFYIGNGGVWW